MARPVADRRHRASHRFAIVAGTVVASLTLGGCISGERARLAPELNVTGDDVVDALLVDLRNIGEAVYSADYDVYLPFRDETVAVTTTQSAPDRRSTTVGDVRFIVDDGRPETCSLESGRCEPGLDVARVSDVLNSADFFGTSLIDRIRRDAGFAVGPATVSTETIAARETSCVAIPLPPTASSPDVSPVSTYCVFDNGVLARLDSADVVVTLTRYSTGADEDQFTT